MKTKFLLLLGLVIAVNTHATTRTWVGDDGNNLWSNPNNWSPTGTPQPGEDLEFKGACPVPFCFRNMQNDLSNVRFNSLFFESADYTLSGNPLVISNRITVGRTGANATKLSVTINCAITLGANVSFIANYGEGSLLNGDTDNLNHLHINGTISLNGFDLSLRTGYAPGNGTILGDYASRIYLDGAVSGTGDVTAIADKSCRIEIGGSNDNTFFGTVVCDGLLGWSGPLVLKKESGSAVSSRLDIKGGRVELQRDDQFDLGSTVVIRPGGELLFDGHDSSFTILSMSGGLLDTGGGRFGLLTALEVRATNTAARINGRMELSGPIRPFAIDGTENPALELNANVFGLGGIQKSGAGTMRLSGTNTFSGEVIVNGGTVEAASDGALGSTANGVRLNGGNIVLRDAAIPAEPLFVNAQGALLTAVGECSWAGPVSLNTSLTVVAADVTFSGERLTLSGAISGSGGLDILSPIFGSGRVRLAGGGANTFTGTTRIDNALLELAKSSNVRAFSGALIVGVTPGSATREVRWLNNFQLPPNANITVGTNGQISLNDFTDTLANLTMSGGHVNLATDSALTVTGTLTSTPTNTTALIDGATGLGSFFLSGQRTFNVGDGSVIGPDLRIDARIAGGGITKIGAGTLALGGNNAFGGPVNIGNGILRVDHDNGLGTIGSGTTVSNGATLFLATAADLVREPVTLNGTGFGGTNGALAAVGGVVLSNNVVLASASTIHVDFGALNIFGTISGTGPLTKTGDGAVTFLGIANNTYSGDTLVNAGTLQLDKSDFLQAVPGNLVIGTGGLFSTPATARHFSQDQIWANVTVNAGSLLDLNGHEEYLLTLTLNGGGDVQTGAGLLTVDAGNSITVNPGLSSATSTISGRLGLRIGNHNINVGAFLLPPIGGGVELDVPAQVTLYNGIANIHKSGSGNMRLGGANTFTGVLYVDGGRVIAANNSALGTTQGSTVVQTNGTLALDGGITTSEVLILDTAAPIALSSMSGSNTVATNINLLRVSTGIEVQPAAGVLQVRGRVGSVGGLTKLGPGTLQFFGTVANDYAGLTVISNGVIEASRGNLLGQGFRAIPGDIIVGDDSTATTTASLRLLQGGQMAPSADAILHRSGLLDVVPRIPLPNTSARLRTVTGAGRITLGTGTSLTISNDVSFDFDGAISGAGALNKYGRQASMHFTGDSTFSGPTTIYEGFYRMDGSAPNSPVTVKLDASLRGDGQVGSLTVESGGSVSPNSKVPGHLGADLQMSSANFLAGGILNLALYGPHQTGGNDSLLVNGPVTLGGTRLSSGFQYAPREGDVITLIRKTTTGPITGTFTGYPEGALRTLGDISIVMSYVGGDGNDVALTVTNLAGGAGGSQVTSGNGNGLIEPDECNLLFLGVQNRRNTAINLSNVVLRSATPSALVTIASAVYPAIPAASIRSNLTPFQIRTLPTHPCGAPVTVELQVTIANEGTFAIPFMLLGGTSCTNGGGACESCTIVGGTFATNTPTLFRRLFATGSPSVCFPEKPCPGPDDGTNLSPARYLKHTFTNTTGSDACLTAQLHFDCPTAPVGALHVAAYLGDVDSAAACPNFLGDTGAATPDVYPPFSFRVPAGSNFVLVISTRSTDIGCDSYWMELFGLPCPPPRLHIADDTAPGNARLHWSTAYPGWTLQSVNSLRSPGSNVFSNVLTPPVVVEGRYTVTNSTASPRQFFRLIR